MTVDFDFRKTVQALHYLVSRLGESNFMKLIKLMYFADRFHLRSYATFLSGDDYKAMKLGPIGSSTMNLLKRDQFFLDNLEPEDISYLAGLIEIDILNVRVNGKCEYEELSLSEKEALDFSVNNFGQFDQWQLAEITHDYPEWKRFENAFISKRLKVADMKTISFLDDPDPDDRENLVRYLGGTDPFPTIRENRDSIREYLIDSGGCD